VVEVGGLARAAQAVRPRKEKDAGNADETEGEALIMGAADEELRSVAPGREPAAEGQHTLQRAPQHEHERHVRRRLELSRLRRQQKPDSWSR